MHLQNIVHRDIKPANLLWSEDRLTVKITDFGVSVYEIPKHQNVAELTDAEAEFLELMKDGFLNSGAGTPSFLAPETAPTSEVNIIKFALDTWALGVTYYCLLFGHPPWESSDRWSLLRVIATSDFKIPEIMGLDRLSTGGRSPTGSFPDGQGVMKILDGLLTKDPENRMTLNELKVTIPVTYDCSRVPYTPLA